MHRVAIEVLARGLGISGTVTARRSLDDVAGTWKKDAAVEKALADQDRVDPKMWE